MSLAADHLSASTHQLATSGTEKLAFKVKSSNDNEYKVKPVFGFVEPGASIALEITRIAGAAKEDKLVVQFGLPRLMLPMPPTGTITIPLTNRINQ